MHMRKLLSITLSVLCTVCVAAAPAPQTPDTGEKSDAVKTTIQADSSQEILFYFVPKVSMFFYDVNKMAIKEASEMIEEHRSEIESGKVLISVNGYSSSFDTEEANYKMARQRSSQVKSYYITNLGMKEEYYITKNHTTAYKGDENVVGMLKLVKKEDVIREKAGAAEEPQASQVAEPATTEPATEPVTEPAPAETAIVTEEQPAETAKTTVPAETITPAETAVPEKQGYSWESSRWSVKTNIPAWALVVPNLAAEYRFADHWSVDVPLYYSCWTTARTYRFRTLAVQPSVRYWLKPEWKGHFFGVHLTAGQFNISVDKNTRYQDVNGMYGVGIDYGYALKFTEHWGMEFNIGAGYIYTKYNSYYNIKNGSCFDTSVKNYWGVTRCGISLIYRIK